jgi:hypothetical protein
VEAAASNAALRLCCMSMMHPHRGLEAVGFGRAAIR